MSKSHPLMANQLILDLFRGEPWDGRSPRALTRGADLVILTAGADGHEVYPDPTQLELWPEPRSHTEKVAGGTAGAPTLLPLPEARQGRTYEEAWYAARSKRFPRREGNR